MTTDGHRVRVLVNAATPAEIHAGLAAGAEGAGLIRTELAFLDSRAGRARKHMEMLAPLLAGLAGRTATVRVLDFGGDKLPPFLSAEPRRGMELLLAHAGAFRAQLPPSRSSRAGPTCGCCSDGRNARRRERHPRAPRPARRRAAQSGR